MPRPSATKAKRALAKAREEVQAIISAPCFRVVIYGRVVSSFLLGNHDMPVPAFHKCTDACVCTEVIKYGDYAGPFDREEDQQPTARVSDPSEAPTAAAEPAGATQQAAPMPEAQPEPQRTPAPAVEAQELPARTYRPRSEPEQAPSQPACCPCDLDAHSAIKRRFYCSTCWFEASAHFTHSRWDFSVGLPAMKVCSDYRATAPSDQDTCSSCGTCTGLRQAAPKEIE